ncbi:N-acetylmuramoyl-L-alanine amidase [Neobacillus sp. 179-C4.2 HS]|uniref:N-acetylmuramoyl-L-alanine amidase n=1 Tax=Neobacillus driksii TaxID=3035913 RepID=A0ABV4Z1P5_9BACI|nr:N-acetylmuramoyl-L-alanine amidase [Neobacillus sp. 179.-C4.2 HS]MDP5195221.1 Ig-like domain-containing protein [Neobacillus sp. 179.-C4.2 HS]
MKFHKVFSVILMAAIVMLLYLKVPLYASAQTTAIGFMDKPVSGTSLNGTQKVYGWLLDESGVTKIEVLVDGTVVGQAIYGNARPDVQKAYPQYNNGEAGFHYNLDTTKFTDGQHTVSIRETGKDGNVTALPASTIMIDNALGFLDKPAAGSTVNGTQNVYGWFLDKSGVATIEILVDGAVVGQAAYGSARPDVLKFYPQYKHGNAGFQYALDTTKFTDGPHTVTVREIGKNGQNTTLPGSTITIDNSLGFLDKPAAGSTINGTQNVYGWFLDHSGVAKIEVLVDGAIVGQAVYGDSRPDVKRFYPQFNNETAGYHFALDTTKYPDGKHTVTIIETGKNGNVTALTERTVTIENTLGFLDKPVSGSTLNGTQNVYGWFLDESGVEAIEILVDGTVVGQATYGDARPDVERFYPQYNNRRAGFHFALDTTQFIDGKHTVTVREIGKNGTVTTLSDRTITVQNAFGYLDNPLTGTTLRGNHNVYGWFLDKSGVAKIEVLVDGAVVGQADYGDARADVQRFYPEFNNGKAGFHFSLDTSKYPDGRHTIAIRETGKNGIVTTLPAKTVTFNQKAYKVFLDPGHGGSDPGAVAGGYKEANLNLAVAKKVQALLLNQGYTVYMSRNDNTYVSLLDRSKLANGLNADIFISIHTNSTAGGDTSANGIESYFYEFDPDYPSKINDEWHDNPERIAKSMTLTTLIQQNMIEYTGAHDRGTAGDTFSVLRESAMPATLTEIGFINNASERQKLITDSYQNKLAKAIADGIVEYFKVY